MNKKLVFSTVILSLMIGGMIYSGTFDQRNSGTVVNGDAQTSGPINIQETNEKKTFRGQLEVFPFEDGVKQADLIVKVVLRENLGVLTEPVPKSIFNAQILSTQKSDPTLVSETISIMQQGNNEVLFNDNPLFQENEEYILFLKKAVDSVAEEYPNLYWILGEETNMYKNIRNNTVEKLGYIDKELYDVENNHTLNLNETTNTQVLNEEEFIKKIESVTK